MMAGGACALTTSLLAAEEGSIRPAGAAEDHHIGEQTTGHADGSSLAESGSIIKAINYREQLLCMYEGLTDHQAKQLLFYHGQNGSFLFVQQADMLAVHIRLGGVGRPSYKKHTILKGSEGCTLEETSTTYQSADDLIQSLAHQYSDRGVTLSPLFAPSESSTFSPSTSFSVPPEYSAAQRHPDAPAKDLPTIRMLSRLRLTVTSSLRYPTRSSSPSGHFSISSTYVADHSPGCFHTCCRQLWRPDPEGRWWYPCAAGPAMCVLLTVVLMVLLLLFGWFVLLLLLIYCAFLAVITLCIYLQTGQWRCKEVFCDDTSDQPEI